MTRTQIAVALGIAALLAVLVFFVWRYVLVDLDDAKAAVERAARQVTVAKEAEPLEKAFAQAAQPAEEPYDIEKTLRVVHELDVAVRETKSIGEFIALVGRQDFRHVAPRALEARKRVIDVLLRYYAAVDDREELDRFWSVFRDEVWNRVELPRVERLRVAGIDVGFEKPGEPPKTAKQREEEMLALRDEARKRVQTLQTELAAALEQSAPVFRELEDEWKRLCLQRDRAYIEAVNLRFDEARTSAEAALAMAPFDEESQLLRALAMVEGKGARSETAPDVPSTIDALLREHPDSAPALLLRGVWKLRHGQVDDGRVDLKLAASRYPEQARALESRIDPYRMRSYLQRSQQGVAITGLYKAMMLGAAWFSPELQAARSAFDAGDLEQAEQLIRDHFARRRAQGQWDLILYDLRFCEDLLGEHYQELFPEHSYLDLHVERNKYVGKDYSVSVDNRSDKSLHNAALVLCVRFTDMQVDDYVTFAVGATRPIVPAVSSTAFDDIDVRLAWGAQEKGASDVVPPLRAILVADEAVFWVDSIAFKDETLAHFADLPDARTPGPAASLPARWSQAIEALKSGNVHVERVTNTFAKDDLSIELPREVALLGPMFRLEIGGASFEEGHGDAVRNRVEKQRVSLLFAGAGAALDAKPEQLRLIARSTLGRVVITFARGEDGSYGVAGVE
jgi:tetratricopeptide (TPR) repeat protein